MSHACANSGAQAVFSLPRKKRPGNEASFYGVIPSPANQNAHVRGRPGTEARFGPIGPSEDSKKRRLG